jgi:hypothetical protein
LTVWNAVSSRLTSPDSTMSSKGTRYDARPLIFLF